MVAHLQQRPTAKLPLRTPTRGKAQRIVHQMKKDAGQETLGLHRQDADDHADEAGDERLLENAVGRGEEDGAEEDRPPAMADVAQPGKDESAEGQFFANRRDDGENEDQLPPWGVGENLLHLVAASFALPGRADTACRRSFAGG